MKSACESETETHLKVKSIQNLQCLKYVAIGEANSTPEGSKDTCKCYNSRKMHTNYLQKSLENHKEERMVE